MNERPDTKQTTLVSVKTASYKDGGKGRTDRQKRLLLFRQQGGKCAICREQMGFQNRHGDLAATLDHIVPRSLGGGNTYGNLRAVHRKCNIARGNSMADVFVEAAGLIALRWNVRSLP